VSSTDRSFVPCANFSFLLRERLEGCIAYAEIVSSEMTLTNKYFQ
jgi:hypothetical protein